MAEPKTRPTGLSVDDFIAGVPDARRRADAQAVRAMLEEVTGEPPVMWGPSIVGFGAYRGPAGDWPVIGFSPRKAALVLYVIPSFETRSDLMARLGKHTTGVSCLYLKKLSDADPHVLRELSAWSVEAVRARYPAA